MRPARIRINEHVAHYGNKLDTPVLGPLCTTKRKWMTQWALSCVARGRRDLMAKKTSKGKRLQGDGR